MGRGLALGDLDDDGDLDVLTSACGGRARIWMNTAPNGQTVSALAPATYADLCEGACYNDARVEIEKASTG